MAALWGRGVVLSLLGLAVAGGSRTSEDRSGRAACTCLTGRLFCSASAVDARPYDDTGRVGDPAKARSGLTRHRVGHHRPPRDGSATREIVFWLGIVMGVVGLGLGCATTRGRASSRGSLEVTE